MEAVQGCLLTDPAEREGDEESAAGPLPAAETIPTPETPPPMLDVHAPHESVHPRKSFLIHIATTVLGLFIAVGLEQTVEYVHHRHISGQLEEQMREVFAGDLQTDAVSIAQAPMASRAITSRISAIGRSEADVISF
jgi:hypothetical protein